MKECIRCNERKPLTEFYKHPSMADGRLGACKTCVKEGMRKRYKEKVKDPKWLEKERERGRIKYYAKGYKAKHNRKIQERYRAKYPEKARVQNIAQKKIERPKGMQAHHWSYREENALCVFFLSPGFHAYVHRFLKYDQHRFCYADKSTGTLLDTREKHARFIESKRDAYASFREKVEEIRIAS
jgi:hypothetical protein